MGLHRRLDDPRGETQEALVEAPLEHRRPFDEVDGFVRYAERVAPAADCVEPFDDAGAALVEARLDPRRSGNSTYFSVT